MPTNKNFAGAAFNEWEFTGWKFSWAKFSVHCSAQKQSMAVLNPTKYKAVVTAAAYFKTSTPLTLQR